MSNKKGFTLVEVLAVIIVLGLLSVIIVPKVVNPIRDSNKKSYEVSVNNLVKALNEIALDKKANLVSFSGCSINFDDDTNTCSDLQYSGDLPTSGSISVDKDGNVFGSVGYGDNKFNVLSNKVVNNDFVLGYQRLDYIMSDGNQYIDLDYAAKINTEIRLDIELIENENTSNAAAVSQLISKKTRDDNNTFQVNFSSYTSDNDNKTIFYWLDKISTAGGTLYYVFYSSVDSRSVMIVKSGSVTFQGVTTSVATKTADNIDKMLLLGNYNASYTTKNKIMAFNRYDVKIYGFQIYEGDILIRDMISCYRVSDDVVGLYDVVNNVFYPSNGDSNFIKGE